MAEGQGSSMDYGYVDSQIAALRSELHSDINLLRNEVAREIQRLEDEMREIGAMIVGAIDKQTAAVVGGVAATTIMIERTKLQIQEDFSKTRNDLALQTESTLQIEVGKKLSDATALKGKLEAFVSDIKFRFDKSIAQVALNRELYNVNFQKITDEYDNKIRTIGEHIFQVKQEDIAPALKAADVPYEVAHGLPIETDLLRLSARAENLDETLNLLKTSRLDEVLSSLDKLDNDLDSFAVGSTIPGDSVSICVEGLATTSPVSTRILVGMTATPVQSDAAVELSLVDNSLAPFDSKVSRDKIERMIGQRTFRDTSGPEIVSLSNAAKSLQARGLISNDARLLLEDFLGSGNLQFLAEA
ncbi:hypothetical protein D4R49_00180 [bacterium]|nr:MAG: hypothetical protein D4R49_00180 [bacterium]